MKEKAALAVGLIMLLVAGRYGWLMHQGKVEPVLATWLLFAIATGLSFWTYWSRNKHSIVGNVNNFSDMFAVTLILAATVFLTENLKMGFNRFEICCLAASGIILVFWRLSKWHAISNLLLQGVLVIGYLPTFSKLWSAPKNTEAFEIWVGVGLASLVSMIPAIKSRDWIATIYASRSLISSSIVIGLMLRLTLR